MKIAIFLMDLGGGGAERVMLNLAQGLMDKGIDVELVLVKAEGPYLSQLTSGIKVICLNSPRLISSLPALVRYLRQTNPEVLISALEDTNFVALWAKKIANVSTRVFVTVHNNLSYESQNSIQLKRRLTPLLVRCFYPWADKVVAVSSGVAKDLVFLGVPENKIHYIYNPIVTTELLEKAQASIDHPWFWPNQPPVILGVGRLTKQKDFSTLIRAVALVKKHRLVRLILLGEGEERSNLECLVQELNLTEDVAFLGFVDNPYQYMKRASVLVLSSVWEGFGNVLVEAMATGTSVISTDCPSGPAEILDYGKYGQLVPVKNVDEMASAILKTLENPIECEILKKRAYQFTLESAVEQYTNVMTANSLA